MATRPLLIVPPCINKFYILDLQPENSFVRYAAEQGQTVFLVSWRNPDASCSGLTWDDYLAEGVMKAIEVALAISRADKLNAVGWCVGGTILASALAVMRARGDKSVASLTLLTDGRSSRSQASIACCLSPAAAIAIRRGFCCSGVGM